MNRKICNNCGVKSLLLASKSCGSGQLLPNPKIPVPDDTNLSYKPRWYHIGDADEAGMALAYGGLALATIFVVEYIFSSLLFSDVEGISKSDIAAHIMFRNSSSP